MNWKMKLTSANPDTMKSLKYKKEALYSLRTEESYHLKQACGVNQGMEMIKASMEIKA